MKPTTTQKRTARYHCEIQKEARRLRDKGLVHLFLNGLLSPTYCRGGSEAAQRRFAMDKVKEKSLRRAESRLMYGFSIFRKY